jgi:hypothetical protein
VAINKNKISKDSKWLKEKLAMIFEKDPNLTKISQSNFHIYGGGLIKLKSSCLVHQYLYANLMELIDIKDLEDLKAKQTIVKKTGK